MAPVVKPVVKDAGASSAKKSSGSLGGRFASFCAGAAISGGLGYYVLMQDVNKTANDVTAAVGGLKTDTIASVSQLNARVQKLEEEIKTMKGN